MNDIAIHHLHVGVRRELLDVLRGDLTLGMSHINWKSTNNAIEICKFKVIRVDQDEAVDTKMHKLLDCNGTSAAETDYSHTEIMQDALTICTKRSYLSVIHGKCPSLFDLWIEFDNPSIAYRNNSQRLIPAKHTSRHTALAQYERSVRICLATPNQEGSELLFAMIVDT